MVKTWSYSVFKGELNIEDIIANNEKNMFDEVTNIAWKWQFRWTI